MSEPTGYDTQESLSGFKKKKAKLEFARKLHLQNAELGPGLRRFLIEELEKAWRALEFYAEDAWKVYSNTSCGGGAGGQQMTCPIDYDQGKRARKALNG